ncbi:hypothetical protein K9N68_15865 [Kovacikia minuta CCNUW1]|uniref:hypothetical protein n=1 Tax=Kovacikia minuta TaxID=2931930 RepID=UPI001CCAA611|nr:hypothetical protein [Kovacikia minuta]UBF29176.1 hypothetical protein K9N68_15865 [Kovacikia minuta CCNUW1]
MNTRLVESLVEIIQSLTTEERSLLETKLNGRSQPTPVTTPQKRLSEFYGALPATQPYPGKEAIRQHVAQKLAENQ